jgi:hypothetical protein
MMLQALDWTFPPIFRGNFCLTGGMPSKGVPLG